MLATISMLLLFYMSQNNTITLLIAIEMLLLTVTVKLMYMGSVYDDMYGTMFSMVIIILAGAESAMGLSILVSYYRLRGKVGHTI
uniref:NADH-ubiquinone oxidoreductase chain 4L n=1 Tax=Candida orthopsilosis TaxID=273371 RepID=A0A1G4DGN9_9ASCO|nr:Nad4L [Candida orthopsilosis]SBT62714.1 Nad4L [Candida orthopsilosis]SBT62730.1 Nad4L [Candida orthopsilosis]SBT62792.1 Nad4L [Candida orthopsilosis]SBT62808.1 Nad4L [Candida orthopsilosis]